MEAKQKAIQEAYGEHWGAVKDFITDNGWCVSRKKVGFEKIIKEMQIQTDTSNPYYWRPKSLQGIENNNGWIKIESEADLPKEEKSYWVKDRNKEIEILTFLEEDEDFMQIWKTQITHYQPIQKPKPPIY